MVGWQPSSDRNGHRAPLTGNFAKWRDPAPAEPETLPRKWRTRTPCGRCGHVAPAAVAASISRLDITSHDATPHLRAECCPCHTDKEHGEATEQQNGAGFQRQSRHQRSKDSDERDERYDRQRKQTVID
jgi:hypothetical protein